MKKWIWIIIGAAIVIIGVSLVVSRPAMKNMFKGMIFIDQPQEIRVGEDTVEISCAYGCKIPVSEIVSVELLEEIPPFKLGLDGWYTRKFAKGRFLLKNGEKCMFFVHREPPCIEMRTTDELYYLNGMSKEETERLFGELKNKQP